MSHALQSIRAKLLAGFTFVIAMAAVMGLSSGWLIQQVNGKSEDISTNWLPSLHRISDINTNTSDFRVAQLQHVITSDPAAMDGYEKEMQQLLATIEGNRQVYVPLISSDQERQIWGQFETQWKNYLALQPEFLRLSREQKTEEAQALLNGKGREQFDGASDALVKLIDINKTGAEQATAEAGSLYHRALWSIIGLTAAIGLVGFAVAWRLSGSLSRRVLASREAADAIAQGRLDRDILVDGDDEISGLQRSMQAMRESLTRVVSDVRHNADSVATASAQIAQGNADLSQRTEEQASALQETAASMDELGSTVRHNADNAQQASQLARTANSVAGQGGEVVAQLVDTMRHIHDSSRRIADIIGVIDGIAFQTNILALNAAVEAARAGEQGRGFAVVAGEVRSLAQRSAEAAREIKQLISASVDRVEQGNAMAAQAGETMQQVVDAIRRVDDIVAEISTASSEQSAGVQQMGGAVAQMDQTTQQNAALVEESAAAAESLRQQASQLVQAVAVFQLANEVHHHPAPAPVSRPSAAPKAAPRPAAPRATRDRKSTRLNSSHSQQSRMPSSA